MTADDIRAWLGTYLQIKKERDGILDVIRELDKDRAASQLRSPRLDGMPHSGRVSDPVAESADKFSALSRDYERKAAALADRMREIEAAIEGLPSQYRNLLRMYYLRGLSWAQVAAALDFAESSCWRLAAEAVEMIRAERGGDRI
ncbi:MAG: sigma-70 family RNA polymerase sigma factor [Clostridia bacterium]|nr:sigma-70 family RNA polymerase sigma factor [Clostridia bacterium]